MSPFYSILYKGDIVMEKTENKSFNKLDRNINYEIQELWDKCFSDLPLINQRLIKAFGTVFSKKAYKHNPRCPITISALQKIGELHIYEGEHYFEKGTPQQEYAESLTNKIIEKLKNGNNQTSKYLKDFLKDKKIKVGLYKKLEDDAGFDGYNPLTKELYIDLSAGLFYYNQKFPELFNEDALARTIGHELGHAVEQANRSHKTSQNSVGYSSKGWEIESFCDAFGTALCIGAGYSLTPTLEKMKKFEDQELAIHREDDPHPSQKQRHQLLDMMLKAYNYDTQNKEATPYPQNIKDIDFHDKDYYEKLKANSKNNQNQSR